MSHSLEPTSYTSTRCAPRHPKANCNTCPLFTIDSVFVPSAGSKKASLAVVGEAPSFQDTKTGKLFTGPSGTLLRAVLIEHELDLNDAFLTNATLCRSKDNSSIPPEAIKACRPRLEDELLELVNLKNVLALGSISAQTLLHSKEGVTKLRTGPAKDLPGFKDVKIIPTVHPAACLRSSDMFPSLVSDVAKLARPLPAWEPPTWKVFNSSEEAVKVLTELLIADYPYVAIDIETGVDRDDFERPERHHLLCIGISYAPGRAIVIGEEACRSRNVRDLVRELIARKKPIFHNGKFDLAVLRESCGVKPRIFFDTMLASYCLDERPGTNSLGYNGAEFLGTPDWKSALERYIRKGESYAIIPRDVLYQYNAWDVSVTRSLFDFFNSELRNQGLLDLHNFLCEVSVELMYVETGGLLVDTSYNEQLTNTYLDSLEGLERTLARITGEPTFNPRSPKQVTDYLASVGLLVADTTQSTLEALFETNNAPEFLGAMLQQRKEQKLYGTYIKGIRKRMHGNRVYPTFLVHGTVSGRLSCRNPNLQNIPRDSLIRQQFVASPGNILLQADYGQAELRVMATLSKDPYLREVFSNPDRDLFNEVGARLYGDQAYGNKELRIRTKAYVYGMSYGREEFSIASEFNITPQEARRGMDAWFNMIPELVKWRDKIKKSVLTEQSDLVTPFSRHRRFWLITKENKKDIIKEAYSFYPQSIANDICLNSLVRLRRLLDGQNAFIRVPVHDSILVECASDIQNDVARLMKQTMEQTAAEIFSDFVPFPVDVEKGPSWGQLSSIDGL